MIEQHLLRELEALDEKALPWWAYSLPLEGRAWNPFGDRYEEAALPPVNAETIDVHLEAAQKRKGRVIMHAFLGALASLVFVATFVFDVPALLESAVTPFLGGVFIGMLLLAPSFFHGYAREAKREILCRLLAVQYDH